MNRKFLVANPDQIIGRTDSSQKHHGWKKVEDVEKRLLKVLEHISNVQRNCDKLGLKLIKLGYLELGRKLIANGRIHDNSKLHGIEFDHLIAGSPILKVAVKHHQSVNPHHPEHWWDGVSKGKGIDKMPDVYFAEMVCDCVARAQEFGTDARIWFFTKAKRKYRFQDSDEVATKLNFYLDLLLEKSFDNKGVKKTRK